MGIKSNRRYFLTWVILFSFISGMIPAEISQIALAQQIQSRDTFDERLSPMEEQLKQAELLTPTGELIDNGNLRHFQVNPEKQLTKEGFLSKYGAQLGLNDDNILKSSSNQVDNLGYTQNRYTQSYKGIPVWAASYRLEEKDGFLKAGGGSVVAGLDIDVNTAISAEEAYKIALETLKISGDYAWKVFPDKYKQPEAQLVLFSQDGSMQAESFVLAYQLNAPILDPKDSRQIFIDAKTGKVILNKSMLMHANETNAYVSSNAYYDKNIKVKVLKYTVDPDPASPSEYSLDALTSPASGMPAQITQCLKLKDGQVTFEAFTDKNLGDTEYFSDNKKNLCLGPVGVGVHWGIQTVWDYYLSAFEWTGFSNEAYLQTQMLGYVLLGEGEDNAFYDPVDASLSFGGVGRQFDPVNPRGPFADLEIVAHEFTHGVQFHTKDYAGQGPQNPESGTLNESLSDIMAVSLKNKHYKLTGSNISWLMSEKVSLNNPPIPVRDFENPNNLKDPDTYNGLFYQSTVPPCIDQNDFCGLHTNMGVPNHWFYLIAHGGSGVNDLNESYDVPPLDADPVKSLEKASKIAFRMMTQKLDSTSYFLDARMDSIEAAHELFPMQGGYYSPEAITVWKAWHAVGVGQSYESFLGYAPMDGQLNIDPWGTGGNNGVSWQEGGVDFVAENEYPGLEDKRQFQISLTPNFEDPDTMSLLNSIVKNGTKSTFIGSKVYTHVSAVLAPNTTYYWRSRLLSTNPTKCSGHEQLCRDLAAKKTWTPGFKFTTSPKAVSLLTPAHKDEKVAPWGTKFSWNKVDGALTYETYLDTQADLTFSNPDYSTDPIVAFDGNGDPLETPEVSINLYKNKDYVWTTVAYGPVEEITNQVTQGLYGSEYAGSFHTSGAQAVLEGPKDGEHIPPWGIPLANLSWKEMDTVQKYYLYFSESDDLSNPKNPATIANPLGDTSYDLQTDDLGGVVDEKTLYWGVQAQGPGIYGDLNNTEIGDLSEIWSVVTDKDKLPPPVLLLPKDGEVFPYDDSATAHVDFSWKAPGADEYVMEFQNYGKPETKVDYNTIDPQLTLPNVNEAEEGYSWRVVASKDDVNGNALETPPSEWANYDIGPDKPILKTPDHDPSGQTPINRSKINFEWTSKYAPEGYLLNIYDANGQVVSGFNNVEIPAGTSQYQIPQNNSLHPNEFYTWTITGVDLKKHQTVSEISKFKTDGPVKPINLSPGSSVAPSNAGTITNIPFDPTTFTWFVPANKQPDGGYSVALYEMANGGSWISTKNFPTASIPMKITPTLDDGINYKWKVRSLDSNGDYADSDEIYFKTKGADIPVLVSPGNEAGNGALVASNQPVNLTWTDTFALHGFDINISKLDSNGTWTNSGIGPFNKVAIGVGGPNFSHPIPANTFAPNTQYKWVVYPLNKYGVNVGSSKHFIFRTAEVAPAGPRHLTIKSSSNQGHLLDLDVAPPGCSWDNVDNGDNGCVWNTSIYDNQNGYTYTPDDENVDMPDGTYTIRMDVWSLLVWTDTNFPNPAPSYTVQFLENGVVKKTITHTITFQEWNNLVPQFGTYDFHQ